MRDFLKSSGHWLRVGWFWPLVLLALPNCSNDFRPFEVGPPAFDPGRNPTSAVMCDIPKVLDTANDCASPNDIATGMRMAQAAIALNQGDKSTVALDYSNTAACSGGPKKLEFQPMFYPDGYAACLNCDTQKPQPYLDGIAVCVAQCIDLVHQGGPQPPGGAKQFCQAKANVSTNFNRTLCFNNACSSGLGGHLLASFVDPRRAQELVTWKEQNGTNMGASGNNIKRTAPRSGTFDAGGYSEQIVKRGDAWVEFQVSDNTKAYAVGFSGMPADHETLQDVPFAIVLQPDPAAVGKVYIFENGVQVGGDHGTYTTNDRFRVYVVQKDGTQTATLSAAKLNGQCTPNMGKCSETPIASQTVAPNPAYPLQVDVSLIDLDVLLLNVTMVRIRDDLP